jgi:hypothetical protein
MILPFLASRTSLNRKPATHSSTPVHGIAGFRAGLIITTPVNECYRQWLLKNSSPRNSPK